MVQIYADIYIDIDIIDVYVLYILFDGRFEAQLFEMLLAAG